MRSKFRFMALFVLATSCSTIDIGDKTSGLPTIPKDAVFSKSGQMFRTGLVIPKDTKNLKFRRVAVELGLPEEFDWRQKAELAPVENQGSCGSCWAFSTSATFQDVRRIFGGKDDLSEQYLLSCAKPNDWSCNGGFFAHDAHMSPKGSVLASEYPYTATDSLCRSNINYKWKLTSWSYISQTPTTDEIKSAIYKYGPISVGVAVDSDFSSYSGGIFEDTGYRQHNHAVNIVGWGKDFWIMRNSWGQSWGEGGYMRIKFGANGIGEWANYVVYDDKQPDPGPSPDPDPNPDPGPCDPQPYADTGYGDLVNVRYGQIMFLGTKERAGHRYYWTAEPAFDNNAQPQAGMIKYRPRITKRLTVHAVTQCGEATDSVTIKVGNAYRETVKPEIEY